MQASTINFTVEEILEEISAFIGLQFVFGAKKMGSQPLPGLFISLQLPPLRASISHDRLRLTDKVSRIDNIDTNEERQVNDNFCHVRKLWDKYIEHSQSLLGETLLKLRIPCSFTQYMSNKLGRDEIKLWILADAQNQYSYNDFPYVGKGWGTNATKLGVTVVKKTCSTNS